MLPHIPDEQVRQAVEAIAGETLAEAGVTAPPVDAFTVARRLGLIIARDGLGATRARFVRLGGVGFSTTQPTILLTEDDRPERRHWAVAHEIGECQAHRVFAELGVSAVDVPADAREKVANRLAGCLLIPRQWLGAVATQVDWDLFALKDRFSTASHELIARRMLELAPLVIITLCDQGRPAWRKGNFAGRMPPMSPPEQAAWQIAHSTGEPARCEASKLPEGVEDVRVWPIHEAHWRREIVRTAVVEQW